MSLHLIVRCGARFIADFVATRNEHLIGAAIVWLAAATFWAALVLPYVRRSDPE